MTTTPLIGFGLDAQYAHRYPLGIVGLCERYRHRLSHLSIVSLFDDERARRFRLECAGDLPVVHHLPGVAPADPDGPHLDRMRRLDRVTKVLQAVWTCEDIAIWSIGPYAIPYFTPPLFEDEIADKVARGILDIQAVSSVPFVAEVPSCAFVVGRLTMGDFFHRVVDQCGCDLVCDVSHVYSYAIARRERPADVLRSLPLTHVRELHISGGHIDEASNQRYIDTHSEPIPADIVGLLVTAATESPNLQCITYEVGVGLKEQEIEHDVTRIERVLADAGWCPSMESTSATT